MKEHFDQILKETLIIEGGYSKDPVDPGGETYKGVARKRHPEWPGWAIIDFCKEHSEFPEPLEESEKLQILVKDFYRLKFWDEIMGDQIPTYGIAKELFDTAVNMGTYWAVLFLQQALNLLNRNQLIFLNLIEDGDLGPVTLNALKLLLKKKNDEDFLVLWMNVLQGSRYVDIMRRNPTLERFTRGWGKRIVTVT